MSSKINLIELYLPDCENRGGLEMDSAFTSVALRGWDFLLNYASQSEWGEDFDTTLSHYFFNTRDQLIAHGPLSAYFHDLDLSYYWIKADPVQYILDINQGVMVPAVFAITNQIDFSRKINDFLSQDDLGFKILDQKNALIYSKKPIRYDSPSLFEVVNKNIYFEQWSGKDKPYWQKLSAELQLLLRECKINIEDPDGVYLWGAGELSVRPFNSIFDNIISTEDSVLGLAKLANIPMKKKQADQLNIEIKQNQEKNILCVVQDFSVHFSSKDSAGFINLLIYYDKLLLDLINLLKRNQLNTLRINTGKYRYELTKNKIIKSYFLNFFKFKSTRIKQKVK